MKYAVVNSATNVIDNVIILENISAWSLPDGTYLVPLDDMAGIGDKWNGEQFVYAMTLINEPEPVKTN